MGALTNIEWADSTWSPWRGCTKISPGCAHCYAETLSKRNPNVFGEWGKGRPRVLNKNWNDPIKWDSEASEALNDWEGHRGLHGGFAHYEQPRRPRVFPSLCDWLDDEVPIEWLARFLKLIHGTPNLDWLLLTKRPENWKIRIDEVCRHWACDGSYRETEEARAYHDLLCPWRAGIAPRNVWIGVSVENQEYADYRLPLLRRIPAVLKFVSYEPALAPVDFKIMEKVTHFPRHISANGRPIFEHGHLPFHWIIVGGESGHNARPLNVEWARSTIDQCRAAGVACFVKQLGARPVADIMTIDSDRLRLEFNDPKGGDPAEWPEDLRVREFPSLKTYRR